MHFRLGPLSLDYIDYETKYLKHTTYLRHITPQIFLLVSQLYVW